MLKRTRHLAETRKNRALLFGVVGMISVSAPLVPSYLSASAHHFYNKPFLCFAYAGGFAAFILMCFVGFALLFSAFLRRQKRG